MPKNEVKSIKFLRPEGERLGITICGGKRSTRGDVGIFVRSIKAGSLAERDGRLNIGDEIVEVDSYSVKECTHWRAASLIKVSNDNQTH